MKNMRKLTALLLAVVMVLSLSIAVFARDGGTITSATINGETATISTTNYITATLNGTTAFSASEYSLRNATISFTASAAPTATGVTFTAGANNTYTATGVDLFNKCLDVTVDGTVYHFAAGLKNGTVDIDDADPLKVVFTIEDVAFTNNAYNVQNPNIGTSEEPDGWTGIAYTVRGTLPAGSDISALAMTVEKNNADATVSGSCVTSEGGDDYTLNLSGTDKMITVTYDDMTRNYYVAATVTDSGKINVTIMIDASNADVAYRLRCPRSIVRWARPLAITPAMSVWRLTAARPSMTHWSMPQRRPVSQSVRRTAATAFMSMRSAALVPVAVRVGCTL